MLIAVIYSVLRLLLDVVDVRLRGRDSEAELLLLRHQLHVLRRQVKRPQLDMADRAIMVALSRRVSRAAWVGMLGPARDRSGLAPRAGEEEMGNLRPPAWPRSSESGC